MNSDKILGNRIKQYRELQKISRDELAQRSGLDSEQLRKIEEGLIPSLGHLIKVSRALGVRLGTFLDDQEKIGPVVVRAGHETGSVSFSFKDPSSRQHLNFFSLAHEKSGRHMEPFIVEIEPSMDSDYKLSSHEGEEFIYVMEGVIEINYGKEVYVLEKGDSIYLDSIVVHNVHAGNNKHARILAVVYAPF